MTYRFYLLILVCLVYCLTVHGQPPINYKGGLKQPTVRAMPGKKQAISDEEMAQLPASASLEIYCPAVGNEDGNNTSVAFATAYYLRTILENKTLNVTQPEAVNANRFSPLYLYQLAKPLGATDCEEPIELEKALSKLQSDGVPLLKTLSKLPCDSPPPPTVSDEAARYRVGSYKSLYDIGDSPLNRQWLLKKALAGGSPVVIDFRVTASFLLTKGIWEKGTNETPETIERWTALCVIGYDNSVIGGAFRVVNSWGTAWGKAGKCWIRYDDLAAFSENAYVVMPLSAQSRQALLLGKVDLYQSTGGGSVPLVRSGGNLRTYQPAGTYPANKTVRLAVSSSKPMHVYIMQLGNGMATQYIPADGDPAPRAGPDSLFIFPRINKQPMGLSDALGQDYLLVLYSLHPIANVAAIIQQLGKPDIPIPGASVEQIVATALGNQLNKTVTYAPDSMSFSLNTTNPTGIIPLLIRL